MSVEFAARLAGLADSEWCALEAGWIPEERADQWAIGEVLEVSTEQISFLVAVSLYNQSPPEMIVCRGDRVRLGPGAGGHTHSLACSSPEGGERQMPEPKIKRMNINVEADVHAAFKAATAVRGENMTYVLLQFIADYIKKNGVPPKKGRR